MSSVVLDAHRPTLREVMSTWPRWARRGFRAAVALLALAVVVKVALPADDGNPYIHRTAPQFNFLVSDGFKQTATTGEELVHFTGRGGQSISVLPYTLPAYRGDVGSQLPILAETEIARLHSEHPDLVLVQEGKTRVNLLAAYSLSYRFGPGRHYGREVLLPKDARTGVRLILTAEPEAGVGNALDVGIRGGTKKPYRSFRFGTERP